MKELKRSHQREEILSELAGRKDHPTADMLYQAVRQVNPKISLGTVYRNLSLLSERGEIKKLVCLDGIERYDYDLTEHDHFVCNTCGRVIDVPKEESIDLSKLPFLSKIGKAESFNLTYYGTCSDCFNKQKKAK